MKMTKYASQEIMKAAVDSDRDIRAKVVAILSALDIELDQLENGLMRQFSQFVVDEYMEGYNSGRETQKICQ
ncbi:MAG: hypothetical protein ACO3LE_11300 [Bdellovibrionota bacterium]